jgi:hypothetical protein
VVKAKSGRECRFEGGANGGPAWAAKPATRIDPQAGKHGRAAALSGKPSHAYGGAVTNSGTRINTSVFNNLVAWKA